MHFGTKSRSCARRLTTDRSQVRRRGYRRESAPEVSYTRFPRRLLDKVPKQVTATIRLEHKPAEQVQVDYYDGLLIVDSGTGIATKTHLFCAVLPFSPYTFGEFVLNQTLPSFIGSHERMWAFFGGVTPYVVIDNLKAGGRNAHRYDPDVNPTYCEYGNHQGSKIAINAASSS